MLLLKKKLTIIIVALFILFFALSILLSGHNVRIQNTAIPRRAPNADSKNSFLDTLGSLFGEDKKNDPLPPQDPLAENAAKDIFVKRSSPEFQKRIQSIAAYIGQSQQTLSLTPQALRFALGEFFLGNKNLLQDARARLENAKADMQNVAAPPEAQVFHALSIELIDEYVTMIAKALDTPRKNITASLFGDVFVKTRKTVTQARTEFRFLTSRFNLPYATPLVILLYDEALGR